MCPSVGGHRHELEILIMPAKRIAIVGPDEMEKHALVYLLPRFLDPSGGEIRIMRKPSFSPRRIASKRCDGMLFTGSVHSK